MLGRDLLKLCLVLRGVLREDLGLRLGLSLFGANGPGLFSTSFQRQPKGLRPGQRATQRFSPVSWLSSSRQLVFRSSSGFLGDEGRATALGERPKEAATGARRRSQQGPSSRETATRTRLQIDRGFSSKAATGARLQIWRVYRLSKVTDRGVHGDPHIAYE